MNDYYDGPDGITAFTRAKAADMIANFQAIVDAFDLLPPIAQLIFANRLIRVPDGETLSVLPAAAARASKYFGFDINGDVATYSGEAPPAELNLPTGASQIGTSTGATVQERFDNLQSSEINYTDPGLGAQETALDTLLDKGNFISAFRFFTAAQIADVTSYTGSLDVTAALQAALDAAWDSDRNLDIPNGLYTVTGLAMPGGNATRTRAFRVYGQGSGELFARGFDGGTIIQSSTDAPILLGIQDLLNAGNGNQEVAYLRFEQTNPAATAAVVDFETLYAQSSIHHCGIFQAGTGDGLRIRHANTVEVHNNYVLNRDWAGGAPVSGAYTGIGIHITSTNDNGLLTLRKNTSRGFSQGFKIGSDVAGEDGHLYGYRLEQCECSVVENGILLTSRARDGVVDNCYFEGGKGGTAIEVHGYGAKILNNHISSGYAVGIDDSDAANYGTVISGNTIGLGNANTAAVNPIGVKAHSDGVDKRVVGNTIIVDHVSFGGVANAKGIQLSGANPRIECHGNHFNPDAWTTTGGSEKIDDNTTGEAIGIIAGLSGDTTFPDVRGATGFAPIDLGSSDIAATVLNLTKGSFFNVSPGVVTSINSLTHPNGHGALIALKCGNGSITFQASATLKLIEGDLTGTNEMLFLIGFKYLGTQYWQELGRSTKRQAAAVADPAGGATVDAEARAAIAAVIDSLQAGQLMAP